MYIRFRFLIPPKMYCFDYGNFFKKSISSYIVIIAIFYLLVRDLLSDFTKENNILAVFESEAEVW